ncbi:MAG TPA: hypothetical protein VJL89_13800 [Thermodesulfovibrionia bacterium]|nr:hypothetical protein [Thermodesulfovibrionia bacterium]
MISDLHTQISRTIEEQMNSLAEKIVERQYSMEPQIWNPFGQKGLKLSTRDQKYHLTYLNDAIRMSDPSLFVDYVVWVKMLFKGLRFPDQAIQTTLQCTQEVIQHALPKEMGDVIAQYLEAGLRHLYAAPETLPTFIQHENPLADLTTQYLHFLTKNERHRASELIVNAVKQGQKVQDVYLHVFQPYKDSHRGD